MPTLWLAMPMRPPSRPDSAIFRPWPSSPSRLAAGTRQFVEQDLRGVAGMLAHLVLDARHRVAGRGRGHDEGADALLAGGLVGDGHDDGHVAVLAAGDELLDAVEHVVVAVAHGGGLQPAGLGADMRLGQAEGAEHVAARQRLEEALLLLGIAIGHQDRAHRAVVDADHGAGGAVAGGDLFQDDGQRQVVEPGAVPFGGHGHAVAAQRRPGRAARPAGSGGSCPRRRPAARSRSCT